MELDGQSVGSPNRDLMLKFVDSILDLFYALKEK